MNEMDPSAEDDNEPGFYEIRIQGYIDHRRAASFEGLTVTREDDGITLLTGKVVDQAALYGLIRKVRDLGMPLVSINRVQLNETQPYGSKKETDQ